MGRETERLNLCHLANGYRQVHKMSDPLDPFTDTPTLQDRRDNVSPERLEKQCDEATYPPMRIEDIDPDTAHAIIRAQQGLSSTLCEEGKCFVCDEQRVIERVIEKIEAAIKQ